jgi:hypothetical protein
MITGVYSMVYFKWMITVGLFHDLGNPENMAG